MNDLAVLIGLVSFPGLVAAILCDKLVVHAERWDSLRYAIYTFVFGLTSYVALELLVSLLYAVNRYLPFLSYRPSLLLWGALVDRGQLDFAELAWATGMAPFVAVVVVLAANRKWIHRVGKKLGISNKFGDENLFSYFLNSNDVYWVYVRDPQAGFSYRGAIRSFSEARGIQELVLTAVTVYSYEDSEELYKLDSLYLSRPLGAFCVEALSALTETVRDGRQEDSASGRRGTWANQAVGREDDGSEDSPPPSTAATPAA